MPREILLKGRYSKQNYVYHITTCTYRRKPLFSDFDCGRLVIHEMAQLHDTNVVRSLAFVVMPDHLHWLFQLTGSHSLSGIANILKGRSAYAINQQTGRKGAVWQKGFYDHAIRANEELKEVSQYIIANPLRAG